jgi:adenine-specific DNA-methyltransferase
MNYIGSKQSLLPFIDETISMTAGSNIKSFTDGFAGTGVVTEYYRNKNKDTHIISNDLQLYSNYITAARLGNGVYTEDIAKYCAELDSLEKIEGFVYNTYASDGVMYFTPENAKKCDAIRQKIEEWYSIGKINYFEYACLIGILIENVDKVANTASIYGAFLKSYKKTALKEFRMIPFNFDDNVNEVKIEQMDVVDLIKNQSTLFDDSNSNDSHVLYLDPPYNERQYASYYHVLETIARYDNPTVKGKTKMRNWTNQKSKWCIKKSAKEELEEVIKNAPQNHIYLSYNNEGIISFEDIKEVFEKYGEYTVFEKEYNRYKADKNREYKSDKTIEYIHYCHKSE